MRRPPNDCANQNLDEEIARFLFEEARVFAPGERVSGAGD